MKHTLPWLCSLCLTLALSLSANAQDFAILDVPDEAELSFALFGESDTQLPQTEAISFAVLDCSKCNCEETGICLCEDCTCPNCPRKPLITAKVRRSGCAPCVTLKRDSKTEALSGFRFEFVETDGDAPIVSWQGNGRKVYFEGWHGVEFFLDSYKMSQKPKRETRVSYRPIVRPAPMRMPRYFAPRPAFGGCAGGFCRSCR